MESYIVDGEVRFRKKLSLDDVYEELFFDRPIYYMDNTGWARKRVDDLDSMILLNNREFRSNCTSEKQVKKLLAIIQLMNVAKYLNGDWQPNWNSTYEENKYYLRICNRKIEIGCATVYISDIVYFKSKELAQQAIGILGEETIKLALCTDW
nr:MAG TPA: hypothetical protein [Bacteriophage sp.]